MQLNTPNLRRVHYTYYTVFTKEKMWTCILERLFSTSVTFSLTKVTNSNFLRIWHNVKNIAIIDKVALYDQESRLN